MAAVAAKPNYTFDPTDQEWGGDKALTFLLAPIIRSGALGSIWAKTGMAYTGRPTPPPSARRRAMAVCD